MRFWPFLKIENLIIFITFFINLSESIKCYSCANDFIVWQWRHFFLKRNYELSASDAECSDRDYISDLYQNCHSTCFVFFLNGTNKQTGFTKVLGVGRGCSASFLTDDQHLHLGLGSHSRPSHVGEYLPHDFDQYDITEHWCFCATDKCNSEDCFTSPFGSREYASSYIAKRLQYSSYAHNPWKYRNSGFLYSSFYLHYLLILCNFSFFF